MSPDLMCGDRVLSSLARWCVWPMALVIGSCGNLGDGTPGTTVERRAAESPVVATQGGGIATARPATQPNPAATEPAVPVAARVPSDAAPPPSVADVPLVAPDPIRFDEAVARAGEKLLSDARARLGNDARTVVIDPLIDANTGGQTVSTASMGNHLEGLVKKKQAGWTVQALTRQALAGKPLLLIGTLTPVNIERSIDKQPDAFRIWLTLIDLRTQRVVAKQLDRATISSVNPEPLPFYRDSPTWHKDKTVLGYINSCQVNTKIGDLADSDYLAALPAAAVVNEAIIAYGEGKLQMANRLYKAAEGMAEIGDLRVLNGLYLTSWQLGQRDAAKAAFDKLVASGLDAKRLPVKILFEPGKTSFNPVGDLPAQYQIWLNSVAQEAAKVPACVRVVGHTSRTGSASVNERLSRQRAEAVARLIEQRNRTLASRVSVTGVGSREALIGLGTDDQRDALDRRVEFRVVDCI